MKKLLLLLITITAVSCNQSNVTVVEFEDEKSNAIRGHYEHYLNNDIDGLKNYGLMMIKLFYGLEVLNNLLYLN